MTLWREGDVECQAREPAALPAVPDLASMRDDELIGWLYKKHGRSLLAYANRLTGDRAAAEDVVQETLLRAWRHADRLSNGRGSVRGWLLTVARNIVTDGARARAVRPREVEQTTRTVAVDDDHAGAVVDRLVMMDALDHLTPKHRSVLIELYFNGRSVAEAAEWLEISPGTVKSRTYYALRQLRTILTDHTTKNRHAMHDGGSVRRSAAS
jgi:RNA polymerase sigma-70 factor (ECF subfamily)